MDVHGEAKFRRELSPRRFFFCDIFLVLRPFQFQKEKKANSGYKHYKNIQNVKLIQFLVFWTMRCLFVMFVTAVCFLFIVLWFLGKSVISIVC